MIRAALLAGKKRIGEGGSGEGGGGAVKREKLKLWGLSIDLGAPSSDNRADLIDSASGKWAQQRAAAAYALNESAPLPRR